MLEKSVTYNDWVVNAVNEWAKEIQKMVYHEWLTIHASWKPGFKIFYGPVHEQPDLMIISLQPGGGEEIFIKEDRNRFENGDFSVPKENSYVTSTNRFGKKMQEFFKPRISVLQEACIIPLIIFRAKSFKAWKEYDLHYICERFSYRILVEIISVRLRPKKMLFIGIETYKKYMKEFSHAYEKEKVVQYRRGGTESGSVIAFSTIVGDVPSFVVIHPTGGRITTADWRNISEKFFSWFDKR